MPIRETGHGRVDHHKAGCTHECVVQNRVGAGQQPVLHTRPRAHVGAGQPAPEPQSSSLQQGRFSGGDELHTVLFGVTKNVRKSGQVLS